MTDPDNGVTYAYYDVGNRKSVTYPNGTVARYLYDSLNRLVTLRNENSSGDLLSGYVYGLKTDGNRESVEELHSNRLVSYTYDRLNRLTEENIKDPANGNETISYTYDDFGNRLEKTDSSGTIFLVPKLWLGNALASKAPALPVGEPELPMQARPMNCSYETGFGGHILILRHMITL